MRNTATVDSDGTDLNPDDNVAAARVKVHPPRSEGLADLVVTKHADHAVLTRGAHVAYLIAVKDRGTDDATGKTWLEKRPREALQGICKAVPSTGRGVPRPASSLRPSASQDRFSAVEPG